MTNAARIAVIDDEEAICDSLTLLLSAAGHSVRSFNTLGAFRAVLDRESAGIVLLDVRLPDGNGLEFLKELRAAKPDLAVIMMTGHGDIPLAVNAMKSGAVDFLEKPFDPNDLLAVIVRATESSTPAVTPKEEVDAARQRLAALSKREREVLLDLVNGATTKEIARRLTLSPRTVDDYRAALFAKTDARNLPSLVRLAMHAGLLDGENP
jgi:two-component system response regulator FixJ